MPVYAVGEDGGAVELTRLALCHPSGVLGFAVASWPLPEESRDGWWDGLPYPILAIRPQGYLGRRLARAEHEELGVSVDPEAWSDDDILWVLGRRGVDVAGNLLVGNLSYERWLRTKMQPVLPLTADAVPQAYARFAEDALAAAGGGSSAAGEFPKFLATRELPGMVTPHVIVKFSGAGDSPAERRWADLLVCEHLALATLSELPAVDGARSRIVSAAGRTLVEVERFDRVGTHGRKPVCALDAIAPAFAGGSSSQWPAVVSALHELGLVCTDDVEAVARLWWFGRLIANTDMHMGNLSFHVRGQFKLAPAYDMLPMLYAPLHSGEVPDRTFEPPLPLPAQVSTWQQAAKAANTFWSKAAEDGRISQAFREHCVENRRRVLDAARIL